MFVLDDFYLQHYAEHRLLVSLLSLLFQILNVAAEVEEQLSTRLCIQAIFINASINDVTSYADIAAILLSNHKHSACL